jgi:hypothetical protein
LRARAGGYQPGMTTPDEAPEQPEAEGIPDPAADTSTAYDEADRPRFDDSPPPLPADRPQALEEFGLTGTEARQGEPLDDRLAREEPELGVDDAAAPTDPVIRDEAVTEAMAAQASMDAEVLDQGSAPASGPVSSYDLPESGRQVGRLSEPDRQSLVDTESNLIARDEGEAGGGATAEEAAIHEVDQDEVPYDNT